MALLMAAAFVGCGGGGSSTAAGTASRTAQRALPGGIVGAMFDTWMGNEGPPHSRTSPYAFDYAGLLKYVSGVVSPKPALAVFKHWALDIEHCRRKATTARACA